MISIGQRSVQYDSASARGDLLPPTLLHDLLLVLGNYFLGRHFGGRLYGFITGQAAAPPADVVRFYTAAVIMFPLGLLLYCLPLRHRPGRGKPSSADYAALVFTSTWAGLFVCALILGRVKMASEVALAFLATGIWFAAAGVVFLLFHRALRSAGPVGRTAPWFHWPALGTGFLLMYPLVIGAFGPIDALAIGMNPALDASRPSGLFDLAVRAGMRAALLGFLAWSSVYIVRKTAARPFGRVLSGWPFFAGLWLSYVVKILPGYWAG